MLCCSCIFLKLVAALALIVLAVKLYFKLTTGWCYSQTCLSGKTVIVTGANTGIGYETALDFAKRGARLILACRDQSKAEAAQSRIIAETDNSDVIVALVDFNSLDSVRKFAKHINETEERLDILVNNAGAGGFEDKKVGSMQQGLLVNYYGPFLLTNLLLNLLKNTGNSRVVNVSSLTAKWTTLNLDKLNDYINKDEMYFRTKLCNILFTIELAKKLKNTTVTTYSLHPGVVATDFLRYLPATTRLIFKYTFGIVFKTCVEGAQTTIYCATQKNIEAGFNGQHFADCHFVERYKTVDLDQTAPLWTKTEELVGLKPSERQY